VTLAIILGMVGLLGASALVAALTARSDRVTLAVGTASALLACGAGLVASLVGLVGGAREAWTTPFATPLGPLHFAVDPLSAFFLVCVFLVSGLGAGYGAGYLRAYIGQRCLAPAVASFNLLVASMAAVVLASDAVAFLMAWELMSLASFFLVTYEDDRADVRRAGMTYLIASHAGVVCLFVLFVLFARASGSFRFDDWSTVGARSAGLANVGFWLALAGFGAKAGFWPMHVWLPAAHPAAPSHVSAVMSGVMLKLGIYGLLRSLDFLGPAPAGWGVVWLVLAAVSGVLGVLHALAQHDLKRLLAYHSVENIGIIGMALGLGLLGRSLGNPTVASLGMAGGLLHVLNHGLFKGLLFQGAGSVAHATHTRELDQLGGLGRRMPHTAFTFLVGAIAISGLPPLNGFVSEWLIFVGAFRGAATLPQGGAVAAIGVMAALALIGGLATACFVKVFGVVFLGEPRTERAAQAHESNAPMTVALWAGAGLCAVVGLGAVPAVRLVSPVASELAGIEAAAFPLAGSIGTVVLVSCMFLLLVGILAMLRRLLLGGREVRSGSTWGCGYAEPTARMQYTAASFADPVLEPFGVVFKSSASEELPTGIFPLHATACRHREDCAERALVWPVQSFVTLLGRLRFLGRGGVQLYLAYVLATLVVLLVWQALAGTP
jgi:hydrogenase-4 component B